MAKIAHQDSTDPPGTNQRERAGRVNDSVKRLDYGSPYENLANAIIAFAVSDYRRARERYKKTGNRDAKDVMNDRMRFFRSRWFRQLTRLEPEILIRGLEEEEDGQAKSAEISGTHIETK